MPQIAESTCAPGNFIVGTAAGGLRDGDGRRNRPNDRPIEARASIAGAPVRGVRSAAGWGYHPLAGKPDP